MVLFCVAENTDCFGPVGLKLKLSLCLINQHAAKALGGGSEVVPPRTLKPPHWMELYNQLYLDFIHRVIYYEGWNFNSGNYLFTADTK